MYVLLSEGYVVVAAGSVHSPEHYGCVKLCLGICSVRTDTGGVLRYLNLSARAVVHCLRSHKYLGILGICERHTVLTLSHDLLHGEV